jgi:hypothetical protein
MLGRAAKPKPKPKPKKRDATHAARCQRSRDRAKRGVISIRIEVDEAAFAAALIESEQLREADALDRRRLAAEAQALIGDFVRRWRGAM